MQRGSSRGDDGPGFSHLRGALLSHRRREGVFRKRTRAEERGHGRTRVGRDASRAARLRQQRLGPRPLLVLAQQRVHLLLGLE